MTKMIQRIVLRPSHLIKKEGGGGKGEATGTQAQKETGLALGPKLFRGASRVVLCPPRSRPHKDSRRGADHGGGVCVCEEVLDKEAGQGLLLSP